MIILYCTDSLMAGGVEQQLMELISRLDRQRYTPFVVCLYGEKAGRSQHFLPLLRALDVPVVVLDRCCKVGLLAALVRVVWRIRPDLIQMINYHGNLLMRLARPFLPRRVRLIGGIYIRYTCKQMLYERLSAWVCAGLVCNSPAVQRQLMKALGGRSVDLIVNGVDLERFSRNSDQGLRQRLAPEATFVLFFMGRITRQKGVDLLVEALSLLARRAQLPSGVRLWIVGEGLGDEAAQLDALIERCQLEKIIQRLPPTHAPEAYYHAADVVVLPSLSEALPNVLLEALAAGRSVIVSEAANADGVVVDGEAGWVVRTADLNHLAERIADVLAMSSAEFASHRERCQWAALPFDALRMAEAYMALYDRLSARS